MPKNLEDAISTAKYLLANAQNAAMATVNKDGSPHNTPFYLIHNETLDYIYWSSHPESLHSKNVIRTGKVFVVLYESNAGGGLYINAHNAHELTGLELKRALKLHNDMRTREAKEALRPTHYTSDNGQRMYCAKPINFYVNYTVRDTLGNFIQDTRHEISREQLN